MRNGVSSSNQYPPRRRVSSVSRASCVSSVVALVAAVLVFSSAYPTTMAAGQAEDLQQPGAPAPALARLFTPLQAPVGAYTVTVLPDGIDAALARVKQALAPGASAGNPAGSWQVQQLDPLEAFGTAGTYDRSKVARLYTGRRVSVVRGPVERGGRVVAAVTLISPYPDATLSRLEKGTIVIVIRLAGSCRWSRQRETKGRQPRSLEMAAGHASTSLGVTEPVAGSSWAPVGRWSAWRRTVAGCIASRRLAASASASVRKRARRRWAPAGLSAITHARIRPRDPGGQRSTTAGERRLPRSRPESGERGARHGPPRTHRAATVVVGARVLSFRLAAACRSEPMETPLPSFDDPPRSPAG